MKNKELQPQEIEVALDDLAEPTWLNKLTSLIDSSHKNLGKVAHLALLSAISAPLPPIGYKTSPFRSKINVMMQGPPRSGKGLIMDVVSRLSPDVVEMGVTSSAALVGSLDKFGIWTPGKAYHARNHVLICRELLQSFRRGEHYQDLNEDFLEIAEFPHKVSKTLASFRVNKSKIYQLKKDYPGLEFPHDNEFEYSSPLAVIASVPVMGLKDLFQRVSDGFLSRFIVCTITYNKFTALEAIDNFFDNLLPDSRNNQNADPELNELETDYMEQYRRMMTILHKINEANELKIREYEPVSGYIIGTEENNILRSEARKAIERSWEQVEKNITPKGNGTGTVDIPPPVLFREIQDLVRLAVADSVSRRLAGTEARDQGKSTGLIIVDKDAVRVALQYLSMITETSVWTMIQSYRIRAGSTAQIVNPSIFTDEYGIIARYQAVGVSETEFLDLCKEKGMSLDRVKNTLAVAIESGSILKTAEGHLIASVFMLPLTKGMKDFDF